ncbi:MAG: 50S ribosomal protein L17 [bacterium]|jgi:large subunit ribosomal protein L17
MNHHSSIRKFGRETDQRRALLKSLLSSFIEKGKIKTTEAKAKEIRPLMEKMITKARVADLAVRRLLITKIGAKATKKLVEEIAVNYKDRTGGYTRITKLPVRKIDAAKMALIEFV